jgi:site-specific recombinase XerD
MPSVDSTSLRRFLRTPDGRRARAAVSTLHRWLDERGRPLAELTPRLVRYFLTWPEHVRVSRETSERYWSELRGYLQWQYDRNLIRFDPRRLRHQPTPLPPLAREFLVSLTPTHRWRTRNTYRTALRHFYRWLGQCDLDPKQLLRRDLASWFQNLHDLGLAPATRHLTLVAVRAYLRWLSEHQRMRTLPDELIRASDIPKLPHYLPRPLTADADRELQRRLAASDNPRAWALLLMRHTGLRISELCDLEYHCARLDGHRPLLKVPLGKLNNERLVPLSPSSVNLIRRIQSADPRPRRWLVPISHGRKPTYHWVVTVLNAVTSDLSDPARITSHRLRHTYATELLAAGMSLVGVMRLLGHHDHRMTLRYAAITPETIGDDYHNALARLVAKYQLPTKPKQPPDTPSDPSRLLDDLSCWLRKHATSSSHVRPLLKRIERLARDIQTLKGSASK